VACCGAKDLAGEGADFGECVGCETCSACCGGPLRGCRNCGGFSSCAACVAAADGELRCDFCRSFFCSESCAGLVEWAEDAAEAPRECAGCARWACRGCTSRLFSAEEEARCDECEDAEEEGGRPAAVQDELEEEVRMLAAEAAEHAADAEEGPG